MLDLDNQSLDVAALRAGYRSGAFTVQSVLELVRSRIARRGSDSAWICLVPASELTIRARELAGQDIEALPLYGIPFAVKDNIDVAGLQTTAACPAFAYVADEHAAVVDRLLQAGAVLIGKTNMDQFATGLVGTRSPYGICRNPFNDAYVAGGSSSGSAVTVASGLVSFALGTDTAGSGRVPAGLNNIVGLKPTRGLLSAHGVVPACRSLDCVSVFAGTQADALLVTETAAGFDPRDPYSRESPSTDFLSLTAPVGGFRFGVPAAHDLAFFGDEDSAQAFAQAVTLLESLGGVRVEIDFDPFRRAAALLYEGPWVAERFLAVQALLARDPAAIHADVRAIVGRAANFSAADVYARSYELQALQKRAAEVLRGLDCLAVPTLGRPYRVDEALADTTKVNSNLGYYTNFVNLLDLAAAAVPAGFLPNGVPFGITLIGPAFSEGRLASLGHALHQAAGVGFGTRRHPVPAAVAHRSTFGRATVQLFVMGAHMSGLPLNHELRERGGRLVKRARTTAKYRLYALEGMHPVRPGMVRSEDGRSIDGELWELPTKEFGRFMTQVPSPLSIGTVELEDGESVKGFLCEAYATEAGVDITHLGGWRAYLLGR